MTRKDFMTPTRYELRKNKIRPIYLNYKEEKELLGYAILNFRVKSRLSELPFIRAEIGGQGKKEADTIIWNSQRWNITFVDPWKYDPDLEKEHRNRYLFQDGFTTIKPIAFFVTIDAYHSS